MKNSGRSDTSAPPRNLRLVERFLEMMAAERGAAVNTLAAYRRDLEAYAGHVAARGGDLGTAGSEDIRSHLSDLENAGMARSSAVTPAAQ